MNAYGLAKKIRYSLDGGADMQEKRTVGGKHAAVESAGRYSTRVSTARTDATAVRIRYDAVRLTY